ncbi:porin [Fuerstiella marisgermanici]|uniref:Porin n=1 Tax=Fuerstiella marisgermanici TaxID=1891926 RepID=A0A1P8WQH7_9PLAN|nr:porin [Fuerstiella marisgermanici]APZ96307.1 hypothetical protein Fuma_05975 [Fuerstiella marisgermanici]
MIRRSWRSLLAGVALFGGAAAMNTASAADIYPTGGANARTQQLFANNGNQLTYQLASMSCSDAGGCCDSSCSAPVGCDLGCGEYGDGNYCGEGCSADDDGGEITFGGWIQMGYHNGITPLSTTRNEGLAFNDHPHRFNLHQGWLYAEKVADGSDGLDWGFRVDAMYGVDAAQTQSFGNAPGRFDFGGDFTRGAGYGFALPQVYGEVATGDLSVKIGHFYTLIGYEVVTAPDNFFYSHALTMFNSEPFTHTGALATYTASDDVTLYGGWTAGWDTGFDQLNNGSSFLGGFSTGIGENITFTYIATAGELGWRGNGYSHSIVIDTALTDDLNYVIQSDLVRTNDHDADPTTPGKDDDIGINQYLIYSLSEKVGLGTRVEWWKNEGRSQYAATFGVNVKPMDNLIVRPEIRHDWKLAAPDSTATTFGIDAILTF